MAQSAMLDLPPLILHPFSGGSDPADVLESSRAALTLAGLLPGDDASEDALTRKLLKGRWEEMRMLCFIGKDIHRWLEQCVESAGRERPPDVRVLPRQTFAELLVQHTPPGVADKLRRWGVDEFASIFRRAIGLAEVFPTLPPPAALHTEFILNYHRFADGLYAAFLQIEPWTPVRPEQYSFAVYTSSEYSQFLESQWSEPHTK